MPVRCAGKKRVALVVALGLLMGWGVMTGTVYAALITFNFEGTVTSVDPDVSSHFSISDRLVGSYSFNSDAPDKSPGAQHGTYQVNQLSFTLGSNAYSASVDSTSPRIEITSNSTVAPSFPTDNYRVISVTNVGPTAGPLLPREFFFNITGDNKFPNDSLPLTPPSLAGLTGTNRDFALRFVQPVGAVGDVTGELTSLTIAPVPLSGAALLFGTGLLGLGALGRIRRTRQS